MRSYKCGNKNWSKRLCAINPHWFGDGGFVEALSTGITLHKVKQLVSVGMAMQVGEKHTAGKVVQWMVRSRAPHLLRKCVATPLLHCVGQLAKLQASFLCAARNGLL